jgi:hypothetical protein
MPNSPKKKACLKKTFDFYKAPAAVVHALPSLADSPQLAFTGSVDED